MLLNHHALLSIDVQCCGASSVSGHAELSKNPRESELLVPARHAGHVMHHAAYPGLRATCPKAQQAAAHEGCAVR